MLLEMNVRLRRGNFVLNSQLALDDTNTGLFGKTGAGKSTILGLIAGTIQPQSGRIVLDGKLLFDSRKGIMMPREQRPISAVFQTDITRSTESVYGTLTSAFNRTFAPRRLKLEFLIEILELEAILDCPLIQLSANERKRVTLARALLKSPRLLLLDETFASLGENYRSQLLPLLRRSQDELDLPILYASQSLGEILELTEQLIVMDKGQVLRSGSIGEIAKHTGVLRHLGVRQVDNIIPVTVICHDPSAGTTLAHCNGLHLALRIRPELPVNSQCKVVIRANDVALSRTYMTGISIQNQAKGRICALIDNNDSILVQIDCGWTILAEITRGACQQMALTEGQEVYCLIKTQAIIYLADLDILPHQRIVSYGNNYYYLALENAAANE
ncbi:molybdenum import ATP-binding protein ModC [Methyloglobulus morosus KoM1]|uniref:Molybdenum import ATP-binding protein ModC n=1 Tax=Methyloglobulus morosus KoM1 TaxID=1116472 RepID=V5C8F5_9GAMM|nr:ATP-binding cassette domain-containing protein [Methyloglobulus morosus]ESS73008.1 molybdenum import ATP-binding protein ModC [Methyloglobulus morosus KoM1]